MPNKTTALKHATILTAYLLIVWGLYRFLIQFPPEVEELFIKPIVWLTPMLFLLHKEKLGLKSIGVHSSNLFSTMYFAFALGAVFAIEGFFINYLKYGQLQFNANIGTDPFFFTLGLSFVTAISEELVFRGFIFGRVLHALKNEWTANIISNIAWSLIHLPIAIFVWKMGVFPLLIYMLLTFFYGFGASFIFARTKNILGSILLHVFWEWPIILFR